jgi:hypothetical protein
MTNTTQLPNDITRRVLKLHVGPQSEPIYSEMAYTVEIDDEAAGEFLIVRDLSDDAGKIKIEPEHWLYLRAAIDELFHGLKEQPQSQEKG